MSYFKDVGNFVFSYYKDKPYLIASNYKSSLKYKEKP